MKKYLLSTLIVFILSPNLYSNTLAKALERELTDAMKLNNETSERVGDSGKAIQSYIKHGYLNKKPATRNDYTDYWLLKKPATFLGHELLVIEEEYMIEFIGCCVSPGVGVSLKINGDGSSLKRFASNNGCSLNVEDSAKKHLKSLGVSVNDSKKYASVSCRERDISKVMDPLVTPDSKVLNSKIHNSMEKLSSLFNSINTEKKAEALYSEYTGLMESIKVLIEKADQLPSSQQTMLSLSLGRDLTRLHQVVKQKNEIHGVGHYINSPYNQLLYWAKKLTAIEQFIVKESSNLMWVHARPTLSLRAKPSTKAEKLARIPYGGMVKLLTKQGSFRDETGMYWRKVDWKGTQGYVAANYLMEFNPKISYMEQDM